MQYPFKPKTTIAIVVALIVVLTGGVGSFILLKGYRAIERVATAARSAQNDLNFIKKNLTDPFVVYQKSRGEATFAVDPNNFKRVSQGAWEQLAGGGELGSWEAGHYVKTKAISLYAEDLCVGLLGDDEGDAEVWCFNETWTQIGGDGISNSWSKSRYVTHLTSFNGDLFAGVDDEVWRLHEGSWNLVGSVGDNCIVYSGAVSQGQLYFGSIQCGLNLYRFDGEGLSIACSNSDERYYGIYELVEHNGQLYLGTIATVGTASVFKYDDGRIRKIGGDGVNGSWINPGFSYLESFTSYRGELIVTLNRMPIVADKLSPVWSYDGVEWRPVGREKMPDLWRSQINYNASLVFNDVLLVSAGGIPGGNASLWALSPDQKFVEIGGHGVNGSWDGRQSAGTAEYIYRLKNWRGKVIAGFGDAKGMAQIWAYTPAS